MENKIDTDIINSIQSKVEEYIDSEYAEINRHNGRIIKKTLDTGFEQSPFPFHKHIPVISEIITDEMLEMARNYYGGAYVQPFHLNIYRNHHIPPEDIEPGLISNQWHLDGDYPDILKIFINISDVNKIDGPLHLVSRKESIGHMPDYDHPQGVSDETVKSRSNVIKLTGGAGTTAMANTNQCLHRAGVPSEGRVRDLLQIKLIPSSEPISQNWLKKIVKFDLNNENRPPNSILS